MAAVESSLTNDEDVRRRQQSDKDISSLESKKGRMTDMLIDGIISKAVYDDKMIEFNRKLHTLAGKKQLLNENINKQKDVEKRMAELRQTLENEAILDEFDRKSKFLFEKVKDKMVKKLTEKALVKKLNTMNQVWFWMGNGRFITGEYYSIPWLEED